MNLYIFTVTSYSDTDPKTSIGINHAKKYGNIMAFGDRESFTKKDKKAPHNEVYGESVLVAADNEAYDALLRLNSGTRTYMFKVEEVDLDIPQDNDRKHELYVGMNHISDGISALRTDLEDYYRVKETPMAWRDQEFVAASIGVLVLSSHIKQVVRKNVDVGFDKQYKYVISLTTGIGNRIISQLNEMVLSTSDDRELFKISSTLSKLTASVLLRLRAKMMETLADILYKNLKSNVLCPVEDVLNDLFKDMTDDIRDAISLMKGFNKAKLSLKLYISDLLERELNKGKSKARLISYISASMPSVILSYIDSGVQYFHAKPLVSYYNIGLLLIDEIKDKLVEAANKAIACKECNVQEENKYMEQVFESLYVVTYDLIYQYLTDMYYHSDSPLNQEVITRVMNDLSTKLNKIVTTGLLNRGDYLIDMYISDDNFSISYGFINFKQDVTPLQVGMVKAILENEYWTFENADINGMQQIKLRINKLRNR
jgi:hypothetical protein